LEVPCRDAPRQGRDVAADGHAAGGGARLPLLAADDRARHRGRDRGRHRLLRKARAGMEGALGMAKREQTEAAPAAPGGEAEEAAGGNSGAGSEHQAESPEAPAETEHGSETGMKGLVDDLHA